MTRYSNVLGIKYLKISVLDEPDKQICKHFKNAYCFIENALNEDQNNVVLVHCAWGKSRSATLVIMFLMKKFNWGFEEAFNYVKRKREYISPNDGFIQQLQKFEEDEFDFIESN
jgi:protein-tyrosine phosphatase